MRYREWILKDLERNRRKVPEKRQPLDWAQIKEDFEQMQMVSNNMRRSVTTTADGVLDYKFISSATSEIKKRASRLKSNLSLPLDEQLQPSKIDGLQMRTLLSALDGLIIRFVKNPIFKTAGVVDAEQSVKARRDLERIIEISDKIRKDAEESKKNNKNAL